MKKVLFLCSIIATLLVSCELGNDPIKNDATIKITSKSEITVGNGNAQGIITYELLSPVAGITIEATANVAWINSFDFSQMGKIGYKVDANSTYDERTGVITISYNGYDTNLTLTQSGKTRPEEIKSEAPYILGHYYGDYANINYNYYLVLSESDYDANGSFYAAGYKYFLDIYSEERPADYNNIRVPNGVYTFNIDNDGRAGTFLESFSIYKVYDESGMEVEERPYSEGTLTVTDDMVKLEVVFADDVNLQVVTYSGDYTMIDKRSESGAIY